MVDMQRWSSLGGIEIPINLVLVIEDDTETAGMIRHALEEKRIGVRVAKDGGQAHAILSMHKPDFVILDLILPGESGYEICERIKSHDESLPVLVVSEIELEDSRELATRVGADGYLQKPVSPVELIETVKTIAERVWERTHQATSRSTDPERIRFNCGCGKKFKVSASHRGKSLTCPSCGEPLIVPKHSTAVS
ncbi:response regulator [bacterium]|nr:response regulator [bacterium]